MLIVLVLLCSLSDMCGLTALPLTDRMSRVDRSRNIVADGPVETAWAPDWEGDKGGGSVDNALHTGAVVDDPWNEELVRVGNMVFPNAEVRPDPTSEALTTCFDYRQRLLVLASSTPIGLLFSS